MEPIELRAKANDLEVAAVDKIAILRTSNDANEVVVGKGTNEGYLDTEEIRDVLDRMELLLGFFRLGLHGKIGEQSDFESECRQIRRVIGFAAETDEVCDYAMRKLERKGCDAIVANDVSRADSGFGRDTNKAWWVTSSGIEEFPLLTKKALAERIVSKL